MLFYVLYYQNDEIIWSIVDLCDPFMLCDFTAGSGQAFSQLVVSGLKHASGLRLSNQNLGLITVSYRKELFRTLDSAARFARDLFGTSVAGSLTAAPKSLHGPLPVDGRIGHDGDWNPGDLHKSGAPYPVTA